MSTQHYRGRFAPSPSGELHFGSLVTAVASFADAKQHDGTWLIRIDDVDQTRTRPGAEEHILATLERFGLCSDEPPQRQSDRSRAYRSALARLIDAGLAYRCSCSRKAVAAKGRSGIEGPIYPGTCLSNPPPQGQAAAWRFPVNSTPVTFIDRVYGEIAQRLCDDVGDFIVFRNDGYCAYQLAVVIDDADQAVTHVVRGADLLSSTPRQIALQRKLALPALSYAHIPLVFGKDGRKLSKRDAAFPVNPVDPLPALRAAWRHLGQSPPPGALRNCKDFWQFAVQEWRIESVSESLKPVP